MIRAQKFGHLDGQPLARPMGVTHSDSFDSSQARMRRNSRVSTSLAITSTWTQRAAADMSLDPIGGAFVIKDIAKKPRFVDTWYDRRSGEHRAYTAKTLRMRLTPTGVLHDLVFIASLERDPGGAWRTDTSRCMVACFPVGTRWKQGRRAYAARWDVESFFRDLLEDQPKPRSKTITSFTLGYYANAVRVAFASLLRIVRRTRLVLAGAASAGVKRMTLRRCSGDLLRGLPSEVGPP